MEHPRWFPRSHGASRLSQQVVMVYGQKNLGCAAVCASRRVKHQLPQNSLRNHPPKQSSETSRNHQKPSGNHQKPSETTVGKCKKNQKSDHREPLHLLLACAQAFTGLSPSAKRPCARIRRSKPLGISSAHPRRRTKAWWHPWTTVLFDSFWSFEFIWILCQ